MSEIALVIVEAIGVGITVHAYDTENIEMFLGGVVFSLLFLILVMAGMAEEKATRR